MSDDESDEPIDPVIRSAFDEIGEVLDKHKLGGVVFAVSAREAAGWIVHYPEWSLVAEEGEYFQVSVKHPDGPDETRKRATLTIDFLDSLLGIAEETIQRLVFIGEHARALFVKHGLIAEQLEIEDVPDDGQTPEHEKN